MKILSVLLFLPISLIAQDVGGGAAPPPGTPAGGYKPTIYNKNYSSGFLGDKANPTEELEAMYPQSSYTLSSSENPQDQADNRSTGSEYTGAQAQAVYWLSLLDQGAFGASYSQAGGLLQDILSSNIWVAGIQSVRRGLGNNLSRKVTNHNMFTGLPHGVSGKFMRIQFDSNFSTRNGVREEVTMMQEGSRGQWKVISYKLTS